MRNINKQPRRQCLWALAVGGLLALGTLGAAAADYPSRTVTLVVPYAPGGATDASARMVAQALQKKTGAPFVVENVPGAGTTVGAAKVAKAAPDGYTLLWGGLSSNVIAPRLYSKLSFNAATAFEPVSLVAAQPFLILTRSASALKSLGDLVRQAQATPDKLNYGSPGQGSSPHLNSELLLSAARAGAVHVPYKGAAPALAALIAGDLDFMSDTPTAPVPMIKAGQLRALAVTSARRLPDLPEVPTAEEAGLPGFESSTWFAVFAPKGTPATVVQTLNAQLKSVLEDPELGTALARAFFTVQTSKPEELAQKVKQETAVWEALLAAKNIRLD